jgi:alpha-beta hydrolase superfamily lysophospholipase
MPKITTKDGTAIYYKAWRAAQPAVPSHGCITHYSSKAT